MPDTIDVTDEELFRLIQAAYIRGANWIRENPSAEDLPYLNKASYDYADLTTSGLPRKLSQ